MAELDFVTSIVGVSSPIQLKTPQVHNAEQLIVRMNWETVLVGVTKLAAPTVIHLQGSPDGAGVISGVATPIAGDGAVIPATLAVGSTAEKVAFGAFPFRINGVNYNKAADAVGVVFTAVHKIAASKFGCIAININAAGTINTQINSTAQTDTLSFDNVEDALANINQSEFLPPTDYIRIGFILIANDAGLWTANTDDITDGVDVDTATFFDITSSYREIDSKILDSDEIARNKGTFFMSANTPNKYIRFFLHTLTGTVQLTIEGEIVPISLN